MTSGHAGAPTRTAGEMHADVSPFLRPDPIRSCLQLGSTLVGLFGGFTVMVWSLGVSYGLTLLLAVPTAGFLVRTFVLQHDLGHGAMFRSRRTNDAVGSILGVLTLIPYHYWRRHHALHHCHAGNLDRRGPGYITTLTVSEYRARRPLRRALYRLYRNPFIVVGVGGLYYFFLQHRFPLDAPRSWKRERRSVLHTNLGIAALYGGLLTALGPYVVLRVQVPVLVVFCSVAAWVFLNQHSYEDTYWSREHGWTFERSALQGSSFLALPKLLEFFTASVGYHHVHHLNPRIPNYRLADCHRAVPELRGVAPLDRRQVWRTMRMALWDEEHETMVGFAELRARAGHGDDVESKAREVPSRSAEQRA